MGSDAKLFVSRSENGGATWTHTEVDETGDAQFSCMAVDGTHVYYSVSDGSLPELCRIMQEGIRTRQREVLTDLDG